MSALEIDPARADSAADELAAAARSAPRPATTRRLEASSSLGAAITTLEHRLVAVDHELRTELLSAAIELRSAAWDARRADR